MDAQSLTFSETWLLAFFDQENGIRWAEIVSGSSPWAATLQPWLALAEAKRAHRGFVLPGLAGNGSVTWYACASSRQDRAALAEQIASFLGPAVVDFDRTRLFHPRAAHERVLSERFAGGVQTFAARAGVDESDVRDPLGLLAGLLLRCPPRPRTAVRAFGSIRAEFEQALLTGDEALARHCIDELRSTGRLSAANERFLQVRLLVALGREAVLVQDFSTMSLLADADLPIRVLHDVIEALYTVHLAPLEAGATPEQWVAAFRERMRRHRRLFRARRGQRAPTVLRAFMLHEVAKELDDFHLSDVEALHEALAALPDHRAWADALLSLARTLQPVASTAGPKESASAPVRPNPAEEESLAHWTEQPPSQRSLAALLRCAMEVGTLEAAAEALAALHTYPAELLRGMSPIQRAMRDALEELVPSSEASDPVLTDWTAWARWWSGAAVSDDARALAIAEQGAEQWDHATWLADAACMREFTDLLQEHPMRFRPYLAIIHTSLHDVDSSPDRQAATLAQMLMLLALDAPSPAELPLLAEWTVSVVQLGAGRALCDEVASALHAAWSEVRSLRSLDWACDVTEALAGAPRTPRGDLERLFSDVLGFAVGQQHRLSPVQRRILGLLARDFGIEFTLAEPRVPSTGESVSQPVSFDGISIGVYTLQESIVPRVRQTLLETFPGATIQFNHDHVATSALEQMARQSSVMVFAWLCSKHQAFYCVQKHRPADKPLLLPVGRGSASIVRALTEHLLSALPVAA